MIAHPFVKLNFGLDVLRKRPDGFHDLETLFVPYHEIRDTLEIIKADDFSSTAGHLQSLYDARKGRIVQAVSDDAKVMVTITIVQIMQMISSIQSSILFSISRTSRQASMPKAAQASAPKYSNISCLKSATASSKAAISSSVR